MLNQSYYVIAGNKDKAITAVNFYATLEQAMTEQRKATANETEQCYVQVGRRNKDFVAAYARNSSNDWVALNEAVWSSDIVAEYKTHQLNIRIPRNKEMSLKTGWGWVNAVVELFQHQLGVEFLNMKPKWQDHVDRSRENKTTFTLRYTCKIPDASVDKLRRAYGVEIFPS